MSDSTADLLSNSADSNGNGNGNAIDGNMSTTKSQDHSADSGISIEGGKAVVGQQQRLQTEAVPSSLSAAPPIVETFSSSASTSLPSIYKRKRKQKPKGILKPAPPPTKAFSFRRDILQQLNTRLAQQGVNVQVPLPQTGTLGSLSGTAQGTAQAAGSILGGMLKRMSGFATGSFNEDGQSIDGGGGERSSPSAHSSEQANSSDRGRDPTMRSASSSSAANLRGNGQPDSSSPTRTNNLPVPSSSIRPLRKVRFTVSNMAIIYPISNTIAPGDEDETRKRVDKEHRLKQKSREPNSWTIAELEQLYRECCRTREEHPLKKMRSVFQEANQQTPPHLRTIDLSFITLDRQAIEPVADLLSVNFGLNKLILENCGLTDDGLKSILHSLLTSGSLPNLSLASNKKIKYFGWRYVGIFMRRAKALKYLDLSENNINKASLEHIAGAIAKQESSSSSSSFKGAKDVKQIDDSMDEEDTPLMPPSKLLMEDTDETSSLTSLRLENCGLKKNSLELLAHSVRMSDLNHLSLRRNRIGQIGAVALAIMIKDYPDNVQEVDFNQRRSEGSPLEVQQQASSAISPQTQYAIRGSSTKRSLSPALPEVPPIVSSPGGGVTRRSMPSTTTVSLSLGGNVVQQTAESESGLDRELTENEQDQIQMLQQSGKRSEEEALSLFYAKRAKQILSTMPRMGNLLTLDLKGNDIRGGIVYLCMSLKKNRTLKVLNLSDNNIEIGGLVAIADALKYNATLETLDLSHNPCCGPGLEGITTLRTAFTLNSNLKRLFISDTDLSSDGAIALAEFLPEAKSLIHLDLTENLLIDIAGVMALAVSVRLNKTLRCLDLNIPPNAPDFARLSQEILNSCIRNTEIAQRKAQQRGVKLPIAAPIYKSTLARAAKEKEERNRLMEANSQLEHAAKSKSTATETIQNQAKVVDAASECCIVLQELLAREQGKKKELSKERGTKVETVVQSELSQDLLTQGRILRDKLQQALGVMGDGDKLGQALEVNDELDNVISKLETLYTIPEIDLQSEGDEGVTSMPRLEADLNKLQPPLPATAASPSSPTFSIGSDEDEEEEEEDTLGTAKARASAAREEPTERESNDKDNDEVNDKARGQLSEEGEIFRRARSLNLDSKQEAEEEQEEEKEKNEKRTSKSGNDDITSSLLPGTDSETAEVSGEELRRELLESDVPRTIPIRQVNNATLESSM